MPHGEFQVKRVVEAQAVFNYERESGVHIGLTVALDVELREPIEPLGEPDLAQPLPTQRHQQRISDLEVPVQGNDSALTSYDEQRAIKKLALFVFQHPADRY